MEKINFESIIATLILLGHEKVDSSLFNNALDIISMGEDFELGRKNNFLFRFIITKENNVFRLKNNININGSVVINNKLIPVRKILEANTNSLLIDYLYEIKVDKKNNKKYIK